MPELNKTTTKTVHNLQLLLNQLIQSYYFYKDLHWNFEGEDFFEYHNFFDTHASSSIDPQDTIAERIRQLDFEVKLDTNIKTEFGFGINQKNLQHILEFLLKMHQNIIDSMIVTIADANNENDFTTADIITGYLESQQKMHWFIRSSSR